MAIHSPSKISHITFSITLSTAPPSGVTHHIPSSVSSADSLPPGLGASIELAVEVDRGADQRQVAEGLREVAELLAGAADLLGEQAQVVSVGVHLLEHQPGLLQPPGPGQRVHVPERAQR